MAREVARAAQALAALARRSHQAHSRPVELAVVLQASPLRAELIDGRLTLEEDILLLGATVRRYDQDHGLKPGDALALVRLSSEDYVALEVLTDGEVVKGAQTAVQSGTTKNLGAVTGGGGGTMNVAVSNWLQVLDDAGAVVGYVPVFATKT